MEAEIKILIGVLFVIVLVVVNVIRAQEAARPQPRRSPRPLADNHGEPGPVNQDSSDSDVEKFLKEIDRMRARQAEQQRQKQQQLRREQQQRSSREEPMEVILTAAPPQASPSRSRSPEPPPQRSTRSERPTTLRQLDLDPDEWKKSAPLEIEKGSLFRGLPANKHDIPAPPKRAKLAKMSGDKKKVTPAGVLLKQLLQSSDGVAAAVVLREIFDRPRSTRPKGGGA